MPNPFASTALTKAALKKHYIAAVTKRIGKQAYIRFNNKLLNEVAHWLDDARLAKLFIEAQFKCFPASWCWGNLNQAYPTINICFGEMSLTRYMKYVAEGVREPL